jgi:hypothetical protein
MSTKKIIIFFMLMSIGLILCVGTAFSQQQEPQNVAVFAPSARIHISGMDSALSQLVIVHEAEGLLAEIEFAQRHGLTIDDHRVQVTVYVNGDDPEAVNGVKTAILEAGGEVQTWWRTQVQALVPVSSLRGLTQHEAVGYIRDPLRGHPNVTSEGDAAIGADDYRASMNTSGEGVKVAILDKGFDGLADLQAMGELPSDAILMSFRADGIIDGITWHGAACAEIVYDIAPDATYYFVTYETDTEYLNTVDWLESEGVNVLSFSGGFVNAGAYDGSSDVSQRIDTARANGILWINAGNNLAEAHWEGVFENDGSGNHVWHSGSGDTVNSIGWLGMGDSVNVYLSWDNWDPYATNDYDLYIMLKGSSGWEVADYSTADQSSGGLPPTEQINFEATLRGQYGILVHKVSGNDQYLELFTHFPYSLIPLNYHVAMGSIPNASDAAGAITVGAVNVADYSESGLEFYSSQGPTNATGGGAHDYNNGSRTKPDIAGPTWVSTASYGTMGGTSAATPHVAGAAVLYMSAYLNMYGSLPTVDQTQAYLENCAEATYDWGTDIDGIKNNQFGAGGLYMCQPSSATPTATATSTSTPTQTETPTSTSTGTETQTPTATLTQTLTNTPSGTNTSTATITQTPTSTNTPTNTSTATPSSTVTSTLTPDPNLINYYLPLVIYQPDISSEIINGSPVKMIESLGWIYEYLRQLLLLLR